MATLNYANARYASGRNCTVRQARKTHLILLILPEQDVEGAGEAPHCQHQQEQKPFDILDDRSEGVHERVLGRLQYSALELNGLEIRQLYKACMCALVHWRFSRTVQGVACILWNACTVTGKTDYKDMLAL